MSELKFSIVTPSFNRVSFIEKTILSVINQIHSKYEYQVVDGASSDGTLDILQKYSNQGNLGYISEPDNGMYDAINKGFANASGDILAYLNTDDKYFPWTLRVVAKVMEDNPDIDIVYGDSLVLGDNVQHPRLNFYPSFSVNWLCGGAIICQPTVFFRKRVFEKLGEFSKDVQLLADCEYWLRAASMGLKFYKINDFLAMEFNHETTLRNMFKDRIESEKLLLLKKYYAYNHDSFKHIFMQRAKYLEKEILALYFIFLLKLKVNLNREGAWQNFRANYKLQASLFKHCLSKVVRRKLKVWKI